MAIQRWTACATVIAACFFGRAETASADFVASLTVKGVTNSNSTNTSTGITQLGIDVGNDVGLAFTGGHVHFVFYNTGTAASAITRVYFAGGSLLNVDYLENDPPNVVFTADNTPGELPGGGTLEQPFLTTYSFTSTSLSAGVNPGESWGIVFNLVAGKTLNDIVEELGSGVLRIGLVVDGFASGGPESFVNEPIPAPASLLLGAIGLAGAMARRRSPDADHGVS